jgi:hypothetical protein
LTDDEKAALVELMRQTIVANRLDVAVCSAFTIDLDRT